MIFFKRLLRHLASLKLSLILLVFSFLLIFFGTIAQVEWGIHHVQKVYFQSFFAVWSYPYTWIYGSYLSKFVHIPLFGGYTLGLLLCINLVCAHCHYNTLQFKKIGITLIHLGLIILIISGFASSALQEESQMWLQLKIPTLYSENFLENELVLIDHSHPSEDTVWSIPTHLFKKNTIFGHPNFPFTLKEEGFFENAALGLSSQNSHQGVLNQATMGVGKKMNIIVYPKPKTHKPNESNAETAYITLNTHNQSIGTWLVSNILDDKFPAQTFEHNHRSYSIALRFKRNYFPFIITLKEFTHEKHPGTQIPKTFSSLIQIQNKDTQEDRTVLINMNHPLRYQGYTFYQASFSPDNTSSMLQVVKNPSWLLPYIAVIIVALGMLIHFVFSLFYFFTQKRNHKPPTGKKYETYL